MTDIRRHPDVMEVDLPGLAEACETENEVTELFAQIQAAIQEILLGKGVPREEMNSPYKGWYRKKFHSRRHPPPGARADLRIIYQLSTDRSVLRILAIGPRLPGSPNDVYTKGAARRQDF